VEVLNLDAASYRQLAGAHPDGAGGVDGAAVRAEVLDIVERRGKMQNPVTGSGGMLVGVVDEVGPDSPLGLQPGDRVATLVSLSLTPLQIDDGLASWDGLSEQVPAQGHAILFGRSIAATGALAVRGRAAFMRGSIFRASKRFAVPPRRHA
jgi:L-erythro-3,5-diaminohexanoate dehydrogenase